MMTNPTPRLLPVVRMIGIRPIAFSHAPAKARIGLFHHIPLLSTPAIAL
jgi:hypothetical protein